MSNGIHLPGLNGLRAIAALSVMWGHTFQTDFGNWGVTGYTLPVAADGVTLFFVISGFLITYLLLHEQAQNRTISIPKFYMRRILRIWPIYYAYMIVALIICGVENGSALWFYGFFAANIPFILSVGIIPIVHYWSLGVEEQFYLFWPWIVKFTHGKNVRLLTVAIGLCVLWLLCKWGTTIAYRFFAVTRFDCMMIGAMGAMLYFSKNSFFLKVFGNRWVGFVSLLAITFSIPWANCIPAPVRPQVIALLSLGAIMSQLAVHPVVNLENRLCDFVGRISYGIYVIHPLVIILLSSFYRNHAPQMPHLLSATAVYLIVTVFTIFVAAMSYRWFEQPFLRMKNRFAIVQSQNSMN
ncbi:MAG: acyltransferase [Bacteroidales bacterium]|nr:acyltransferase [Bacteroidales bacterium]